MKHALAFLGLCLPFSALAQPLKRVKRLCLFLFMVGGLFTACTNDNPPHHIKVVAYKQGKDAVMVYAVLSDKNGQPTAANGMFSLRFTCDQKDGKGKHTIYDNATEVKVEDFKQATVGTGASKHEQLAYSFGPIWYIWFVGGAPAFERFPRTLGRSGDVSVEFYEHREVYTYSKGVTSISY